MADFYNLVGKTLGDYRLTRMLNTGGMAHIYLGEDTKLGRLAALKVLSLDTKKGDGDLAARFEREARAVAQLEHDNITPIYQFGEQDGLYFLAMRYIEGSDLSDELEAGRKKGELMLVDRALNILRQVASALDYAHQRGIIHRDVKPSNVLLGPGDKAFLSDFGLVLWQSVDKSHGTAFGTPRYISPEQATDSQSVRPQSDIYSLGVMAYEILTGQLLFKGATPMEIALSHITEAPIPPRAHNASIPPDAQSEILRALEKDAAARHESATEFIDNLRDAYRYATTPEAMSEAAMARTIPFAPLPDVATASDPSILDSWNKADTPTVTPTPAPTPVFGLMPKLPTAKVSADSGRLGRLPLIALPVLVIIGAILLFSSLASGPRPPGLGEAAVVLRYNAGAFTLVNISEEQSLDLRSLQLSAGDAAELIDNANGRLGQTLAPGQCISVRAGSATLPSDWACSPVRQIVLGDGAPRFWHAETAADTRFRIQSGNARVADCDTVGRAIGRVDTQECNVNWPALSDS